MGKKTGRQKRLGLFERGNRWCPVCLTSFTRDAVAKGRDVTLEHAPPKTLGGAVRCLTCTTCNSSAGRKLDLAAERMNRIIMDREAGLGRKVVLNAFGSQETGYFSAGGLDPEAIRRLPGSPDAKQLRESFLQQRDGEEVVLLAEGRGRPDSKWGANKGITITMPKEPPGNYVIVSWLRSAYLLVFSLLGQGGYRYAESDAIRPIRDQIMNPDEEIAPPLLWNLSAPLPEDLIAIQNRRQPFCWVVKIGSMVGLLPHGGTDNNYGEVVELADQIKTLGALRELVGPRCRPMTFGPRAEVSLPEDLVDQDLFGRELIVQKRGEDKQHVVVGHQQGLICTCLFIRQPRGPETLAGRPERRRRS